MKRLAAFLLVLLLALPLAGCAPAPAEEGDAPAPPEIEEPAAARMLIRDLGTRSGVAAGYRPVDGGSTRDAFIAAYLADDPESRGKRALLRLDYDALTITRVEGCELTEADLANCSFACDDDWLYGVCDSYSSDPGTEPSLLRTDHEGKGLVRLTLEGAAFVCVGGVAEYRGELYFIARRDDGCYLARADFDAGAIELPLKLPGEKESGAEDDSRGIWVLTGVCGSKLALVHDSAEPFMSIFGQNTHTCDLISGTLQEEPLPALDRLEPEWSYRDEASGLLWYQRLGDYGIRLYHISSGEPLADEAIPPYGLPDWDGITGATGDEFLIFALRNDGGSAFQTIPGYTPYFALIPKADYFAGVADNLRELEYKL